MKYTVIKNAKASQILDTIKRKIRKEKATTEYLLKMPRHRVSIPISKTLKSKH